MKSQQSWQGLKAGKRKQKVNGLGRSTDQENTIPEHNKVPV